MFLLALRSLYTLKRYSVNTKALSCAMILHGGLMEDALKRAGALLAAQRKRETRPCEVCGKMMPNATKRRRFCSNACKLRARRPTPQHSPGSQEVE